MSQKIQIIGILGTGQLAEFIITGINKINAPYNFILSPRSHARALKLKNRFNLEIAESNQSLLDSCDMVFICLPAKNSLSILSNLNFRKENNILSAMAGITREEILKVTKCKIVHTSMMPGYANASNKGPSLLFPENFEWKIFLSFLGPIFTCETEKEFNVAAVIGAVSGASFVLFKVLSKWFSENNLSSTFSQNLLLETLRGNIEIALESDEDLSAIISKVATSGGITESLVDQLNRKEALLSWGEGMDTILRNNISKK